MNLILGSFLMIALLYGCTELAHVRDCDRHYADQCARNADADS